jgi:hypothetical protein
MNEIRLQKSSHRKEFQCSEKMSSVESDRKNRTSSRTDIRNLRQEIEGLRSGLREEHTPVSTIQCSGNLTRDQNCKLQGDLESIMRFEKRLQERIFTGVRSIWTGVKELFQNHIIEGKSPLASGENCDQRK